MCGEKIVLQKGIGIHKMNKGIFRKKSIDKVSSPEALNDYVKVASPSVWVILIGIIILLIGVCVWGVMGRLDTTVNVGVTCNGSENICYISESDINNIKVGQIFEVAGTECEIVEISKTPIQGKELSPLMLHTLNVTEESWIYEAKVRGTLNVGEYGAYIVIESVSPMSFVIN